MKIVRSTHAAGHVLTVRNLKYAREVDNFVLGAYRFDAGYGDITTALFPQSKKTAKAVIVANQGGVLAGLEEVLYFLAKTKLNISLKAYFKDGSEIKKGNRIATMSGRFCDIVAVERTALNTLGRMSGIATSTRQFIRRCGRDVLITPTRKTYWGLLDKKACSVGGGGTHRLNLADAVLVKDTHMASIKKDIGGLFKVLINAGNYGRFIEIEVQDGQEALKAAAVYQKNKEGGLIKPPLFLMFDNFMPKEIRKTLGKLKAKSLDDNIYFEASGGINLKNIREFANAGVDIISAGALTRSAVSLDLSLKII